MIVQAIGLLDDLDKELNTYAMRVREWYGWHFPEMARIITDNIVYAKAVSVSQAAVDMVATSEGHSSFQCKPHCVLFAVQIRLMGTRDKAADMDFSEIPLEEEVESQLKEAAVISMGTEVSEEDMLNIIALCDQVCRHLAGHTPLVRSGVS